jgi:hypothetical protein
VAEAPYKRDEGRFAAQSCAALELAVQAVVLDAAPPEELAQPKMRSPQVVQAWVVQQLPPEEPALDAALVQWVERASLERSAFQPPEAQQLLVGQAE